jgi:hypothetical protein
MELVQSADLLPILVIDDADAWLQLPGGTDRRNLAEIFFGQVLRSLADLPCGLVVAAHDECRELAGYQGATGLLEVTIQVPPIPDPGALARLIRHRVACHLDHVVDVVDQDAMSLLFDYYRGPASNSLRRTLLLLQGALEIACDGNDETITTRAVEAAHAQP